MPADDPEETIMHWNELPHSTFVRKVKDRKGLAYELSRIIRSRFTHFDIITGAKCSGRILFSTDTPPSTAATLYGKNVAYEVAEQLMKLIHDRNGPARYDPAEAPQRSYWYKGWEIRRTTWQKAPAIIAWAAWIDPNENS